MTVEAPQDERESEVRGWQVGQGPAAMGGVVEEAPQGEGESEVRGGQVGQGPVAMVGVVPVGEAESSVGRCDLGRWDGAPTTSMKRWEDVT
jgi:hypothetical protein